MEIPTRANAWLGWLSKHLGQTLKYEKGSGRSEIDRYPKQHRSHRQVGVFDNLRGNYPN